MTRHDQLDDDARDLAALAALGMLPAETAESYERHLAGCEVCRREVAALRSVVGDMAEVGPEAEPPERLWSRIEAGVRALGTARSGAGRSNGRAKASRGAARAPVPTQAWKQWADDAARAAPLAFVAAEGPWSPTAVPGIEARKLFVDERNDRVTMLVRMAPGSAYPSHRHGGPEECFVLEGDLRTGDVVQHAGEYQRAEVGSVHPSQSTEKGCVLLIVSSMRDTLIAA